jgi:hypothetical protein
MDVSRVEILRRSKNHVEQTLKLLQLSELQINRARDDVLCGWELLAESQSISPPEIISLPVQITQYRRKVPANTKRCVERVLPSFGQAARRSNVWISYGLAAIHPLSPADRW